MSKPEVQIGQKLRVWEHRKCNSRTGTVVNVHGRRFDVRCDECNRPVTAYYKPAQILMLDY